MEAIICLSLYHPSESKPNDVVAVCPEKCVYIHGLPLSLLSVWSGTLYGRAHLSCIWEPHLYTPTRLGVMSHLYIPWRQHGTSISQLITVSIGFRLNWAICISSPMTHSLEQTLALPTLAASFWPQRHRPSSRYLWTLLITPHPWLIQPFRIYTMPVVHKNLETIASRFCELPLRLHTTFLDSPGPRQRPSCLQATLLVLSVKLKCYPNQLHWTSLS